MFKLNKNRLKEGSFKYIDAESKGYKEGGISPFTVADYDFLLPEFLSGRLNDYTKRTSFGYNALTDDYLTALVNWMKDVHQFEIDKSWVTVSNGVIPAIANALYAFTNERDAVCIMSPVYHWFYKILDNLNRKKVIHNLEIREGNYEINFDKLEEQFKNQEVKVMLFCSPHNPVGKVWPKDDLLKLSNLCVKYDVLMISDEIHLDLILNGYTHTVYPSISEDALNHTILCTAASKTFNLAGLKTSNIIIPNEELRNQYLETAEKLSLGTTSANSLGLYATQIAYENGHKYLNDLIALIEENYKTILEYLSGSKIEAFNLEGTYLLWLDFRKLNMSQDALITRLENKGLFLSNGLDFGDNGEGFMRMNLATSNDEIIKAMKRLISIEKEGV